jgi:hypothetical protein
MGDDRSWSIGTQTVSFLGACQSQPKESYPQLHTTHTYMGARARFTPTRLDDFVAHPPKAIKEPKKDWGTEGERSSRNQRIPLNS